MHGLSRKNLQEFLKMYCGYLPVISWKLVRLDLNIYLHPASVRRVSDLGEFDDVTSGSGSRDVEVVEGNVAVVPCPGAPPSRPAAAIEFTRNGVKVTQSGQ